MISNRLKYVSGAGFIFTLEAWGEPVQLSAEAGFSTLVIDRGEQIGGPAMENSIALQRSFGRGEAYVAVYRLSPFGPHQDVFDDEVDYTLGYVWSDDGYQADLSANWLTYPGEPSDESLELAGAIAFDAPMTPELAAFIDAHTEDWGLEVTAGPSWTFGYLDLSVRGRGGFVHVAEGDSTRSYAGVESAMSYPLADGVRIGGFVRAEWADKDSFVSDYGDSGISDLRSSGLSAGVSVSWSGSGAPN